MPPKKNKAPLVIGIIAGVLVLGGAATAAVIYTSAHKDRGQPYTNAKMPGVCGNVSEAALAKARATNPSGSSNENKIGDETTTNCGWGQTKGKDGEGLRTLNVYVYESKDGQRTFDEQVTMAKANNQGQIQVKDLDIGDQSTAVLMTTTSAFTGIEVVVRKGDKVVNVDYIGWDVGLFSPTRPDVPEFEEAAKAIAAEMIAEL
ncbi:hypothetical protein FKR81_40555 [Lentzea tibetensis]|uniref:DUF3558 domain-containing protein n=1 Tax=Lentzea tibetensis TaxID=2591470 RepID=A0A563EG76_9PSEU|nr:hypothetical protein [Lentzea tibetensis]TWP44895.1 hypothetical protein FKR81_40555 [Lentzea tibetensis]